MKFETGFPTGGAVRDSVTLGSDLDVVESESTDKTLRLVKQVSVLEDQQ
jgi:hypothetical protein